MIPLSFPYPLVGYLYYNMKIPAGWRPMKVIEKLSRIIPRISEQDRVSTCDEIRLSASPGFDYYLLVLLSGSIATLGLLTNSAAVIIGAMLLAP